MSARRERLGPPKGTEPVTAAKQSLLILAAGRLRDAEAALASSRRSVSVEVRRLAEVRQWLEGGAR